MSCTIFIGDEEGYVAVRTQVAVGLRILMCLLVASAIAGCVASPDVSSGRAETAAAALLSSARARFGSRWNLDGVEASISVGTLIPMNPSMILEPALSETATSISGAFRPMADGEQGVPQYAVPVLENGRVVGGFLIERSSRDWRLASSLDPDDASQLLGLPDSIEATTGMRPDSIQGVSTPNASLAWIAQCGTEEFVVLSHRDIFIHEGPYWEYNEFVVYPGQEILDWIRDNY